MYPWQCRKNWFSNPTFIQLAVPPCLLLHGQPYQGRRVQRPRSNLTDRPVDVTARRGRWDTSVKIYNIHISIQLSILYNIYIISTVYVCVWYLYMYHSYTLYNICVYTVCWFKTLRKYCIRSYVAFCFEIARLSWMNLRHSSNSLIASCFQMNL